MEKSFFQNHHIQSIPKLGAFDRDAQAFLIILALVQAVIWSLIFNQPVGRSLQNATLAALGVGWTLWLHRRWSLVSVISRGQWLLLMNLLLAAVSLVHWGWIGEGATQYGTGISDAHYVLDVLKGEGPEYAFAYVAGYALWLYPIVAVFGFENFYAIALVNTLVIAVAALALAVVLSGVGGTSRAVPLWLFLFHPYSVVLAATIYKDPLVICGTLLVFAGVSLSVQRGNGEADRRLPDSRTLIAVGLIMAMLARLSYSLVLVLFVGVVFLAQAVRQGRIRRRMMRDLLVLAIVLAIVLFAAGYAGSLEIVLNSFRRFYDPSAAALTASILTLETGGYVADEASLGVRYLSGSFVQRLATFPLQIAMQLVSPFPPRLLPIDNVYLWVEECFGLINLTLAPLLAIGLLVAIRSRDKVLKLVPLCSLFIILPAIAFGGVVGRQLSPIVPFIILLAWLGWRATARGPKRVVVVLMIPAFWATAFWTYYYLRAL